MPYRSFDYAFYVDTPNVQRAYGYILNSPYYLWTNPTDPTEKVWRPGPKVTKNQSDVLDYRSFVLSKNFYVLVMPIVADLNSHLPTDPATIDFDKQLFELNQTENLRWLQWFKTATATQKYDTIDFTKMTYPADEALTVFEKYPYAKKGQTVTGWIY